MKKFSVLFVAVLVLANCQRVFDNPWDPSLWPYSVIFFANGADSGSPPPKIGNLRYLETLVVPGNTGNLVKTNFYFSGWNTSPQGDGTQYNPGASLSVTQKELKLYAVWTAIPTYQVVYNLNGGTGTPPVDSNSYYSGDTVTVASSAGISKLGHTFSSWNTQADGSGTSYAPSSQFSMPSQNVTLYAIWNENLILDSLTISDSLAINAFQSNNTHAFYIVNPDKTSVTVTPNYALSTWNLKARLSTLGGVTWSSNLASGNSFVFDLPFPVNRLHLELKNQDGTQTKDYIITISKRQIADAGVKHSFIITTDGEVFGRGNQSNYVLGNNVNTNTNVTSTYVEKSGGGRLQNIVTISTGFEDSLALNKDGNLFHWGRNEDGAAGQGNTSPNSRATLVNPPVQPVFLSVGNKSSYFIDRQGFLWATGRNSVGQLGQNDTVSRTQFVKMKLENDGSEFTGCVAVSASKEGDWVVCLREDGTVWAAGNDLGGQMFNGSGTFHSKRLIQIASITNAVNVGAGFNFGVMLLNNGEIRTWGSNSYGQLSNNTTTINPGPTSLTTALKDTSNPITGAVQILAGAGFFVHRTNAEMFAVGDNAEKQLGANLGGLNYKLPVAVVDVGGSGNLGSKQVMGSYNHTLAVDMTTGQVYGWGNSQHLQISNTVTNVNIPILLTPTAKVDLSY